MVEKKIVANQPKADQPKAGKKVEAKKTDKVAKPKAVKDSGKFAVIKTGGKQYIVKEGDKILVEKLSAGETEKVEFNEVLLIWSGTDAKVGTPFLKDTVVKGKVLTVKRMKKVIVFKMKAKKRYRKTQGHRQTKAEVLIEKI